LIFYYELLYVYTQDERPHQRGLGLCWCRRRIAMAERQRRIAMAERLIGVQRWRGEELWRRGLGLGHGVERRRGGALALAMEAL
jgi:hypothetical protein